MRLEVRGTTEVLAALRRVQQSVERTGASALRKEAVAILSQAKANTPVETGDLRDSGEVVRTDYSRRDPAYDIGFSGPHAVAIHEHPSNVSPPSWKGVRNMLGQFRKVTFSPEGTGPKYLERAVNKARPGLADRIAAEIRYQ